MKPISDRTFCTTLENATKRSTSFFFFFFCFFYLSFFKPKPVLVGREGRDVCSPANYVAIAVISRVERKTIVTQTYF